MEFIARRSNLGKFGRKLLTQALDGFYYFADNEIEDTIERALDKYPGQRRQVIRNYIWSHEHIRTKICQLGRDIYGPV